MADTRTPACRENPAFETRQAERTTAMSTKPARRILIGAAAATFFVAGCTLPAPGTPNRSAIEIGNAQGGAALNPPAVRAEEGAQVADTAFTPWVVSRMRNIPEFKQQLIAAYPGAVYRDEIGGTAKIRAIVDDEGELRNVRVEAGSGNPDLDWAALEAVSVAQFEPARRGIREERVYVKLIPVIFTSATHDRAGAGLVDPDTDPDGEGHDPLYVLDGERFEGAPDVGLGYIDHIEVIRPTEGVERYGEAARGGVVIMRTRPPGAHLGDRPYFTPYTTAPELTNRREFHEALQRLHPPPLRERGIDGPVILRVFIDREGRVMETRIKEGSGHSQLDAAAEEAMRDARFAPARHGDVRVPVWVELPVSFRTDRDRDGSPDYSYIVQVSSEGISAQCEYGCAWKELSAGYSRRYRLSAAGVSPGVGRAEDGDDTTFQHLLTVSGSGISATCEAGCRWRTASATSPQGRYRITHEGIETLR